MFTAKNKKTGTSVHASSQELMTRFLTPERIEQGWEQEVFVKDDSTKLRYSLIPPTVLAEEAAVMTFGAKKYSPDNWRKCGDLSRYVDAAMRHFEAWRGGETLDLESGLHHLAHARCCLAFLMELEQ